MGQDECWANFVFFLTCDLTLGFRRVSGFGFLLGIQGLGISRGFRSLLFSILLFFQSSSPHFICTVKVTVTPQCLIQCGVVKFFSRILRNFDATVTNVTVIRDYVLSSG